MKRTLLTIFNAAARAAFRVIVLPLLFVIEHLEPANEPTFLENVIRCLRPNGVLITGTPNVTAAQYASPQSQVQHINLKSMDSLRALMERYFENVFMFGMNDEVVHTGYAPMCQYIWSVAVGVRR